MSKTEAAAEYTSRLGDIAKELNVSAVKVGTQLRAAGLRSATGYPTEKAIAEGLARSTWDGQERRSEWHIKQVLAALRKV